jgi:hypothetical protein
MSWVLVVGAGWLGVGAVVALIVGRSIRLADAKARAQTAAAAMAATSEPNFVVEQPMVDTGPSTVPSFDAQVADLPVPREVPPVKPAGHPTHPPVIGGCVPASERAVSREPGLT